MPPGPEHQCWRADGGQAEMLMLSGTFLSRAGSWAYSLSSTPVEVRFFFSSMVGNRVGESGCGSAHNKLKLMPLSFDVDFFFLLNLFLAELEINTIKLYKLYILWPYFLQPHRWSSGQAWYHNWIYTGEISDHVLVLGTAMRTIHNTGYVWFIWM